MGDIAGWAIPYPLSFAEDWDPGQPTPRTILKLALLSLHLLVCAGWGWEVWLAQSYPVSVLEKLQNNTTFMP
jgi:hypothetical protein